MTEQRVEVTIAVYDDIVGGLPVGDVAGIEIGSGEGLRSDRLLARDPTTEYLTTHLPRRVGEYAVQFYDNFSASNNNPNPFEPFNAFTYAAGAVFGELPTAVRQRLCTPSENLVDLKEVGRPIPEGQLLLPGAMYGVIFGGVEEGSWDLYHAFVGLGVKDRHLEVVGFEDDPSYCRVESTAARLPELYEEYNAYHDEPPHVVQITRLPRIFTEP